MRSRFIFQILYHNTELYLSALRALDRKANRLKINCTNQQRNEELIELMELEKPSSAAKATL